MLFALRSLLLVPVLLSEAIAAADHQKSTATVRIRNGTVVGVNDDSNRVQRFLGIPYAQPPIGQLRLQHAQPLDTSFGTLHADSFGPACYGPKVDSNPDSSEDCLTLNIWRSSEQRVEGELKPVLVWLYGGGLRNGYTVCRCVYADRVFADLSRKILGSRGQIWFASPPKSRRR
jgi:carboxylesterase type B